MPERSVARAECAERLEPFLGLVPPNEAMPLLRPVTLLVPLRPVEPPIRGALRPPLGAPLGPTPFLELLRPPAGFPKIPLPEPTPLADRLVPGALAPVTGLGMLTPVDRLVPGPALLLNDRPGSAPTDRLVAGPPLRLSDLAGSRPPLERFDPCADRLLGFLPVRKPNPGRPEERKDR